MKNRYYLLTALVVIIGLVFAYSAQAGKGTKSGKDNKADKGKLPDNITAVIKDKYPGSKIEEAGEDFEGISIYEVEVEQENNEFELSISPDGKLIEQEQEIGVEDLPMAVQKVIKGAKIEEATKEIAYWEVALVKLEEPKLAYEVIIEKNGEEVEIKFDENGVIIGVKEIEENDDENCCVGEDDDDDNRNGNDDDEEDDDD